MKHNTRSRRAFARLLQAALAAATIGTSPFIGTVMASDTSAWPQRPIKVVVPAAVGGVNDLVARMIAPRLARELGQQIVIENKPGADFAIGAQAVARAAPDGYTLLAGSIPLSTTPLLKKVPYNLLKDFVPVGNTGNAAVMLVVPPGLGVKTLKAFNALAGSKPSGSLNFANAALGSLGHLNVALLGNATGMRATAILYPGQGALVTDLLAGRVDFAMLSAVVAAPFIANGQLVPLAIVSNKRSPILPEVPTMKEEGFPDVNVVSWTGILAPAGTPPAIVARLNAALMATVSAPEIRSQLDRQGIDPVSPHTAEAFKAMLEAEQSRWPAIFEMAGIERQP